MSFRRTMFSCLVTFVRLLSKANVIRVANNIGCHNFDVLEAFLPELNGIFGS